MKLRSAFFLLLFGLTFTLFQGCDTCTNTGTITIDEVSQNFSITYKTANGVNYMDSLYNLNNITVLLNTTGGKGQYKSLTNQEDFGDGKFGPFPFSQTKPFGSNEFPTYGVPYDYVYVIQKDTFGVDTFQIKFLAQVDECHEFWQQIEYYKNGDPLASIWGNEIADIEIVE